MNRLFGSAHNEILDWLAGDWLRDGPTVCLLEGFSGVGKTAIADTLGTRCGGGRAVVHVEVPQTRGAVSEDLLWTIAEEMEYAGFPDMARVLGHPDRLSRAFVRSLRAPILVVVDEFQRAFPSSRGQSLYDEVGRLLHRLGRETGIPGRVLLLTNRTVSGYGWAEPHAVRTVTRLDTEAGVALLERLLGVRGLEGEVPAERHAEVVEWVGGNPRAIRTVVESLRYESLERLIGIARETGLEERHVSPELVRRLEERLLDKILERLEPEAVVLARNLAVHRRPFQREVMDLLTPPGRAAELRGVLIDHFLVEQHRGDYALTEVVRHVLLARLSGDPAALAQAHQHAADYYVKFFRARRLMNLGRLGGQFIEARYHLSHAGRREQLNQIATRFAGELASLYMRSRQLPTGAEERDEQIAVLEAVVEVQDEPQLHARLVNLLLRRETPGDTRTALEHARAAAGPGAAPELWLQLIRLSAELDGPDAGLQSLELAVDYLPTEHGTVVHHQECAGAFEAAGRPDAAIDVLRRGVDRNSRDARVFHLYRRWAELLVKVGSTDLALDLLHLATEESAAGEVPVWLYVSLAELLQRVHKPREAMRLIRSALDRLQAEQNPIRLYTLLAELLASEGELDALPALVREGAARTLAERTPIALYERASILLWNADRTEEAINLLHAGISEVPAESAEVLYTLCAQFLRDEGREDEAVALLRRGIEEVPCRAVLYLRLTELIADTGAVEDAAGLLLDAVVRCRDTRWSAQHVYVHAAGILARAGGIDRALAVLDEAVEEAVDVGSLYPIYHLKAKLLSEGGRVPEAIALLREGIGRVGSEHNAFVLYHACAELLADAGEADSAIHLLREGIGRIRPEHNVFTLYQPYAELLARNGRVTEAAETLREGIGRIRPGNGLFSLYQALSNIYRINGDYRNAISAALEGVAALPAGRFSGHRLVAGAAQLALLLRDQEVFRQLSALATDEVSQILIDTLKLFEAERWIEAAEHAHRGLLILDNHVGFTSLESFCWLAAGRSEAALRCLEQFPQELRLIRGNAMSWLLAFVALRNGRAVMAREAAESYLGRPLRPAEELDEAMLLRMWDESVLQSGANPAFIFPHLPPSLTGLAKTVTRLPNGPSVFAPETRAPARQSTRFLVMATEWSPGHGGLSSFNQELCVALARAGSEVECVVQQASDKEIEEALASGVRLLSAPVEVGDTPEARLYRRPGVVTEPDVVIGHGRKTGPVALVQCRDYFPTSLRVHVVHTAPDHIEWFKERQSGDESAAVAEERTRLEVELAAGADLVVGVGPLLTDWVTTRVRFGRRADVPIHRLDPGLAALSPSPGPPPEATCLLLGRAEDEVLKGIDIAASAISRIPAAVRPGLVVRGALPGKADSLRVHLTAAIGSGVRVDVRRYSSDRRRVGEDLRESSLVLMPSRSEGFGLVGLEAISAAVPVLVSGESGLGRLLREMVPALASHFVVDVLGDVNTDAATWAREIEIALRDRHAAFARAQQLRNHLQAVLTWERAVEGLMDALTPLLQRTPASV
jgi:tetratricopeptide (TPR) repeat protein